jgi:hypothetical protein
MRGTTEAIDLGGVLFEGMLQTPGVLMGMVAANPGPWIGVGAMMIGLVVLSRLARRRRR